jgi:hypothetical protein
MRNRQSVVVHSWQDFFGQVVVEAQLMLRGRKAEVRRPPSARDEPAQLLSCLLKFFIVNNLPFSPGASYNNKTCCLNEIKFLSNLFISKRHA